MSNDLSNQLRSLNTFEWMARPATTKQICFDAADRIEKLEAALREITSVSKVYVTNGEDMAQALLTLLASHRKMALNALEGKDDC